MASLSLVVVVLLQVAHCLERPKHVQEALSSGHNLYYFGLGSNMLRSKVENRGINNTKIDLLSMEPAVVPNYRLAFNMRGFLPLEPGMGSLEAINATSRPLLAYDQPECHGALICVTPENYERIMRSEGVSDNSTGGYEEVVVDAYPYGSTEPVQAVALRARNRLAKDPAPSLRYMTILREGAAELGLKPCYRDFLDRHPVQQVPRWLRRLAVHNLIFTFTLSFKLKKRWFSKAQSWLLFRWYHPSPGWWRNGLTALVLSPGAAVGTLIRRKASQNMPPFLQRMLDLMEEEPSRTKNATAAQ